ncbi:MULTISPECIES: hydantoinase/oxoprolinase family protein [unclassified Pseudodesulfovibrio]|uniref:hydantoinase/oxoprolinase family protein n=1 Tax=unclassified Pseudodesulfovibrio TaxID=2661612 RepID=UPI000FEC104B|nr:MULTISPECIES: hydantoinase/oxoprolinase family protein [unclassified Pseudodesulfovibrio]MCJ2165463.1 hydantoinase/oxoprolinase family protein [Pseudodesulfovibrio sp. S3-i]RWU03211.1 hydantoinase/oxoprolinase family protein [Pseudodesulfovibrio sp. S3]
MLLGIDVGGTHTDAVAIDTKNGVRVAASCKVPTRHKDLLSSVTEALETILKEVDQSSITQLNLSTTLSTNAIVQGKTEDVGVIVSSGPGIDPHNFMPCKDFHVIEGSIDHRGNEVRALSTRQLANAIETCRENGVRVFAAVSKFSTRNPRHENLIRRTLSSGPGRDSNEPADFVTLGHQLGGSLNFPRRVATAYFNCAVWRIYNDFATAVEKSLNDMGLAHVKVNILKADGGTMPLPQSRTMPVQSIFSGPAASVMGIIALTDIFHDSIILDIGGTTTDIAVFAEGAPLIEPEGINIGSHPTLVTALKVHSIGIGGDSAITVVGDEVRVGPNRIGPSVCLGGEHVTLTDALNHAGICSVGDTAASLSAIASFADKHSFSADKLAEAAIAHAADAIHDASRQLVAEINAKPVYTIHELIEGKKIVPKKIYLMGGPAQAMKMEIFSRFQISTEVPDNFDVANAIGAALTRTTWELELFADTQRHVLFIPTLSYRENVHTSYDQTDAEKDAVNQLTMQLDSMGVFLRTEDALITHSSSFNMVEGMEQVGKNIRVKCQVRPGVVKTFGKGR